ncbi:KUP/HAK/KT family potassium transporter [uncultured Rhodoblastus sp.]|uniref:KUP/HAK/KT family potassium transporter n=1 Tax=uncultured Rhodoblastus sp. TaxID=543037 RepID=UPI0025D3EED0|nr:KUP/HAK/KT family potassium transporter [uncultured Rhodoblastus sp.]
MPFPASLHGRADALPKRPAAESAHAPRGGLASLSLGALGVVYGGIGTSPLYAMDQIFHPDMARTAENVLGGVSLVLWALTVIGAIEYALLALRAQNEGEGGVFALYGLLHDRNSRFAGLTLWSLMLGAGLLLGDGMITPAISVLSAVDGLQVATPALGGAVIPITLALLAGLFAMQSRGTAGLGKIFGPVVALWFAVIAVLGARQVLAYPEILAAFNPVHGLRFLIEAGGFGSLAILGAVMLVVTGSEAMYADLGHFGAAPIRLGWFAVVFPALLLNYLGQGAHLLSGAPTVGGMLFFSLAPPDLLYPLAALATVAAIIASQSLVSGAFSLTLQAIRLGLFPRIALNHTHADHAGQIYVPFINWALFCGCVLLVVSFGSAGALAGAYGLAVSGVMVITSMAMYAVARRYFGWGVGRTALVWGGLTAFNGVFLLASTMKFFEGGFIPLLVGLAVFAVMTTWRWGRKATFAAYKERDAMTLGELVEKHRASTHFMERNALVMSPKKLNSLEDRVPVLMQMLWDRYGVLPRHLVFVEITHLKAPYVGDNRYKVTTFYREADRGGVMGVSLSFGFMEEPDVEKWLEDLARHKQIDLPTTRRRWIVHVSNDNPLPARKMGFWRMLRFKLFLFLRLVSRPAYYYYGLGNQVQLSAEILPVRLG